MVRENKNEAENSLKELQSLLEIIGFENKKPDVGDMYNWIYKQPVIIDGIEMPHQLEYRLFIRETPYIIDDTMVWIRIILYNNDEVMTITIKQCIEFLKFQFKHILRKHKITKVLNG